MCFALIILTYFISNIPFVRSPEGTAAALYDQYIIGVTQVLDKHAPIILGKLNSSLMSGCLIRIAWLDLLGGNLNEGGENISQS